MTFLFVIRESSLDVFLHLLFTDHRGTIGDKKKGGEVGNEV